MCRSNGSLLSLSVAAFLALGFATLKAQLPEPQGRILHLAGDQGVLSDARGVVVWEDQSAVGGENNAYYEPAFGSAFGRPSCAEFPNGVHDVVRFTDGGERSIDPNEDPRVTGFKGSGMTFLNRAQLSPETRSVSVYAVVEVLEQNSGMILSNYSNAINWGYGYSVWVGGGSFSQTQMCFQTSAGTCETWHDWCGPARERILDDGWYVVTATVDFDAGTKKMYVDGVLREANEQPPFWDLSQDPTCILNPSCEGDVGTGPCYNGKSMSFIGDERPAIGCWREFPGPDFRRRYHNAGLAELIVYDSVSEDQRLMVEAELRAKYFDGTPPAGEKVGPSGFVCTRSEDELSVNLEWDNCGTYEALVIRRNGALFANLPADDTSFVDNTPDLGEVTYEVLAEFSDASLDGPSCTVSALNPPLPTPPSAPDTVAWWDAGQGVTTDGGGVTTWADQASGDNDAVTRVEFGASQPQVGMAVFPAGDRAVLNFNGDSGMGITNDDDLNLTEATIAMVVEAGSDGEIISNYTNATQWGYGFHYGIRGDNLHFVTSNGTCGSFGNFDAPGVFVADGVVPGNWHVITSRFSNTTGMKDVRVDDALFPVVNSPAPPTSVFEIPMGGGSELPAPPCPMEPCDPHLCPDELRVPEIGYVGDNSEVAAIGSFREFVSAAEPSHNGGIAEIVILNTADLEKAENLHAYLKNKYFGSGVNAQVAADCNQDGVVDLSDVVCLLGHLFQGSPEELPCETTAANLALMDCNQDGGVDLSDAIYKLAFLFQGGPEPVQGSSGCIPIPDCPQNSGCP